MAGPTRGDDADDRYEHAPDGPPGAPDGPPPSPDDSGPPPSEPRAPGPDGPQDAAPEDLRTGAGAPSPGAAGAAGRATPARLDDATVAARWAELTSALGELGVPADPRPDAANRTEPRTAPLRPAAPPEHGPRDYSPPETDEGEAYVPPEPEPLTHADPVVTLGWVAVVGSVALGFVLSVVWRPVPDGVLGVLALALVAGVGLLLWRMPPRRDHDDRSDGAVV